MPTRERSLPAKFQAAGQVLRTLFAKQLATALETAGRFQSPLATLARRWAGAGGGAGWGAGALGGGEAGLALMSVA